MTPARFRLILLSLPVLVFLAAGYHTVQKSLNEPSVRTFLESKAGEFLKAQVKIGKVHYVAPAGISLEKIQIHPGEGSLDYSIASIEKLILGYGLLNLIRRDFNLPSSLTLEHPRIDFNSRRSPFPFLSAPGSLSKAPPAELEIRGGEFRYPGGGEAKELVLSNVQFRARFDARGRIQVKLRSRLEGMIRGELQVRGVTDPSFQHYELEVELADFSFSPQSGIPIQKLRARFHMSEKTIQVKALTSLFHDWEIKGEGRIEDWQTKPKVFLDFTHRRAKPPFVFSLRMDFESEKLSGQWGWAEHSYPFQGKVRDDGRKILFWDLEMPHGYRGKGEVDRSNGDYDFNFEQAKRRFRVRSNLTHLGFEMEFQLDHASINHLDWVVSGKARLRPLAKRPHDKTPRFLAEIWTDYLIVEFEPLHDFRGSFELSSEGIQAVDLRWSKVFQLGGGILFRGGKPKEDLVLRVEGFALDAIREFAGRPIPPNLSGILEGKLKFRGAPSRPEIQGYFTISDGTIEKLKFDHAIIQFQGFAPYLKIYDSNIFKGRNTLKLTGAINLALQNIFHGIQIRRPDHLVIWKGMSVYWKKGQSAIEAEKPLGDRMTVGLELGSGVPDSSGEDPEESHAVLGPKLKF